MSGGISSRVIDDLIAAQRYDEALLAVQAARAAEPEHLPYAVRHAAVLRRLQRPADAMAALMPLLTGAPGELMLRDELAICLRHTGDAERSLQLADETLAAHPDHRPALLARIDALISGGDTDALSGLAGSLLFTPDEQRLQPARRQMVGEALARIVPHLRHSEAQRVMTAAAESIAAAASLLRPEQLWPLYVAADQVGLAARYRPVLESLFSRDRLSAGVCLGIVQALHRNGDRDWESVADRFLERLAPQERWRFRLECGELAAGAEAA
ncbi:hypothetical protein, partial [Aestuariivirga sp.]|uniref:hypothetical protein n=1 Tax=Aestuariivirga sp. TaxID=2650926 RepID=UPI0035935C8F